ncbi:hypothetical protein XOCgx_2196 [Xanthomonas oryzae pv. oryzicola]|nr:hypothetical protein XOCgx_2196 [Xanthomonas oryzae pv. oryzicola]
MATFSVFSLPIAHLTLTLLNLSHPEEVAGYYAACFSLE